MATLVRYFIKMNLFIERTTVNRGGNSGGIGTGVLVVIIIAAIGVLGCIGFGLVKMCKGRPKASRNHYGSDDAMNMGQPMQQPLQQPPPNMAAFSTINEPPPYSTNDIGGYPQVPVPYPPGPDNQYMQGGNAPYPPAPGGPAPYNQAPGYPPYPQAPGAPGYQPYPPQGPGYPPQGAGYPPYPN